MKKKIFLGLSISTIMLASCGGSGEESTEETTDTSAVEEVVIEPATYSIDSTSEFKWTSYDAGEPGHVGSIKASSGSVTLEGDVITSGNIEFNMNTLTADAEKLTGHLAAEDFFNIANFASSSFTMEKHEEGVVYGTLSIIGLSIPVEASVTVVSDESSATITASEFKINFSEVPFFAAEVTENVPEAERHDPNIGVTATIKGIK